MSQRYELPRFKKALEAFAGQLSAARLLPAVERVGDGAGAADRHRRRRGPAGAGGGAGGAGGGVGGATAGDWRGPTPRAAQDAVSGAVGPVAQVPDPNPGRAGTRRADRPGRRGQPHRATRRAAPPRPQRPTRSVAAVACGLVARPHDGRYQLL